MNCDSGRKIALFAALFLVFVATDGKNGTVSGKKKNSQSQMVQPPSES